MISIETLKLKNNTLTFDDNFIYIKLPLKQIESIYIEDFEFFIINEKYKCKKIETENDILLPIENDFPTFIKKISNES
jgi:hypothetical protein